MLHLGCLGALLRGEGEGPCPLQPNLLEEIKQLLEFFRSFAGKAGDQAGADHKSGNLRPQLFEQLAKKRAVPPTVHQLQNMIVAVLNGDIQIFHDFGFLCHHPDEFIIDLVGIDIVNANPVYPLDFGKLTQQLRKQTFVFRQIRAVTAGVLSHHDQFLHAGAGQHPCLVEHIVHLTAAVLAPQGGDHTVGTAIVAALRDFDVGIMLRSGENPPGFLLRRVNGVKLGNRVSFQQRFDGRYDFRIAARTQDTVHLWHFLDNLVLVALRKAAGNQNLSDLPLCLQRTGHENMVDGLRFGGINKPAGVDHNHIAAHNLTTDGVPRLLDTVHHPLAVHLVFGTSKGDKSNHRHLFILRKFIRVKAEVIQCFPDHPVAVPPAEEGIHRPLDLLLI